MIARSNGSFFGCHRVHANCTHFVGRLKTCLINPFSNRSFGIRGLRRCVDESDVTLGLHVCCPVILSISSPAIANDTSRHYNLFKNISVYFSSKNRHFFYRIFGIEYVFNSGGNNKYYFYTNVQPYCIIQCFQVLYCESSRS